MSRLNVVDLVGAARAAADDPRDQPRFIPWVGVALAACLASLPCAWWTSTFAYSDFFIFVTLAILPAVLVLIVFMVQDSTHWPYEQNKPRPSNIWKMRLSAIVFLILFPPVPILFANQALDTSSAVLETGVVTGKENHSTRRRGQRYQIAFATQNRGPLGRWSLRDRAADHWAGGGQKLQVSRGTYGRVQPGRTKITLRVHKGLFGFPWYEADSVAFSDLSAGP